MFDETNQIPALDHSSPVDVKSGNRSGNPKPFLKWAGGKSQLVPLLLRLKPREFSTYIEPFVGGGALFFALGYRDTVIADLNPDLIVTYQSVRDDVYGVLDLLEGFSNDEKRFYQIRSLSPEKLSDVERAARFIYLNKTCFNGLYRVNKKGMFNVPYNGREGRKFYDRSVLIEASLRLKDSVILHSDYKLVIKKYAKKNDFVFLDPPYQPVGKYSDFNRYTKEFFYEKDQIELAEEFKALVRRGCKVLLTNSAHPLIFELYKEFEVEVADSKRLISSDPKTRTSRDAIVLGGF